MNLLPNGRLLSDGKSVLNELQYEMVTKVANRVSEESEMVAGGNNIITEPMRWSTHGGPGTGKSYVI